jgi:hypothetical protein
MAESGGFGVFKSWPPDGSDISDLKSLPCSLFSATLDFLFDSALGLGLGHKIHFCTSLY